MVNESAGVVDILEGSLEERGEVAVISGEVDMVLDKVGSCYSGWG